MAETEEIAARQRVEDPISAFHISEYIHQEPISLSEKPKPNYEDEEAFEDIDMVRLYLNGIDSSKLLTAEQEVDLAKSIAVGTVAAAALYLKDQTNKSDRNALMQSWYMTAFAAQVPKKFSKKPQADKRQTRQAHVHAHKQVQSIRRISSLSKTVLESLVTDGEQSRIHMTEANLGLVVSIAKRYPKVKVSFLDLIQHGNLGLLHAIDMFDYGKGIKFSTYATWWIKKAIQTGMAKEAHDIVLPTDLDEEIVKYKRTKDRLESELATEPHEAQMAAATGMSIDKIRDLQVISKGMVRLDQPVDGGVPGSTFEVADTLGDLLSLSTGIGADSSAHHEKFIHSLLEPLKDTAKNLIIDYFGLFGRPQLSIDELSQTLGVNPHTIRSQIKTALQLAAKIFGGQEQSSDGQSQEPAA